MWNAIAGIISSQQACVPKTNSAMRRGGVGQGSPWSRERMQHLSLPKVPMQAPLLTAKTDGACCTLASTTSLRVSAMSWCTLSVVLSNLMLLAGTTKCSVNPPRLLHATHTHKPHTTHHHPPSAPNAPAGIPAHTIHPHNKEPTATLTKHHTNIDHTIQSCD